jgi:hypothetical protein
VVWLVHLFHSCSLEQIQQTAADAVQALRNEWMGEKEQIERKYQYVCTL